MSGNKLVMKLVLFFLMVMKLWGLLCHVEMMLGTGQMRVWQMQIGWSLRVEAMLMSSNKECSNPDYSGIMNVIIWNCRGALKPNFQNHVRELVRNHNLAILVVMETRIGGERARGITNRLPFENVVHTNTIVLAKGLWMLWNS